MGVNEKMTALADAIRAKTGGTGLLSLDAMASAIASIQTGSGGSLPEWMTEMTSGTAVFASDTYSVEIAHGLSGKPKGFVFFREGPANSTETFLNYCYGYSYKFYNNSSGGSFYGTLILANGSSVRSTGSYNATATAFLTYNDMYDYKCKAGTPYYWIAWR